MKALADFRTVVNLIILMLVGAAIVAAFVGKGAVCTQFLGVAIPLGLFRAFAGD